jgi:O-antigen/teichoic acid export membrane protein
MNEEGADEYYSRVLTYIVFVSMFLALCVAAVAGDGLLLYAVKGYWAAALIIPLLAMSAVLDCASRVLNIGITLKKRTIYAPLVIAIALAINIGLNFLLIPRYGSLGATVSTLISYVAFCGLRYWASNLFYKVRYEWGRVSTLVALGALMIALFYLNDHLRGDSPARATLYFSLLIKAALALSFPLLLFALRFFDERERRRFAEIWGKFPVALRRRRLNESVMIILISAGAILLMGCLMLVATKGHG